MDRPLEPEPDRGLNDPAATVAAIGRFFAEPQEGNWASRCEARVLFGVVRAVIAAHALLGAALWIPGVAHRPGLSSLILGASALPLLGALALGHRGRVAAAGAITTASLLLGAMAAIASFGGVGGPVVFSLPLTIVASGLLRGLRAAVAAAAAGGAFLGLELALERAGVAPFVTASLTPTAEAITVLSGIVTAISLIAIYAREVEASRREVSESARRALAVERELADMFRFAPDGMAVLDAEGVIELANEAMASISGRSAASLVGMGLPDLPGMGTAEARESVLEGIARLHERGESLMQLTLTGADDVRVPVEVHARFIPGRHGQRKVQLVVRDMSFRAEAERARDRLESQLREARRMEALGRLAGGVAHDFRNLLTPILCNVGLLRSRAGLGPADQELASEIELAAERADALTQQLLAFARRQRMELRAIDVNAVVREIEPILRRLLRGDIALHLGLAQDLGALSGDRTQLEQVIVNLVANARDAMPRGGSIRIETGNVSLSADEAARQPDRRAGEYVALTVADTGTGMPEEVRRHVFEPFFTTKGNDRGTGLGLATVHGIVSQCGGSIEVESALGRGTVFRILFPRVDGAPARASAALQAAAAGSRRARILVVDDDALVRAAVVRTLRAAGHGVTEAPNGADALEIASREPVPFDLLVTDVVMPRMAGGELASRFRSAQGPQRVLFMSGYTEGEAIAASAGEPPTGFLAKPFSRDGLLAKVDALLA
jgi:PAS domain S-box-containing protein